MEESQQNTLFDYASAVARMGGDTEIYTAVALVYLDTIDSLVTSMKEGAKNGDHERVMREAHSAKSSSRIVGADRVGNLAEELESKAKEEDSRSYTDLINQITQAIDTVRPYIKERCH